MVTARAATLNLIAASRTKSDEIQVGGQDRRAFEQLERCFCLAQRIALAIQASSRQVR